MNVASGSTGDLASEIIAELARRGETVGVAESLTGGLVIGALTAVPGASAVVQGGVVAYSTDVKADILGVPQPLLLEAGPVDPEVAIAMARGARQLLLATYGVATTGEAGPESASGKPVGTVHVAVSGRRGDEVATTLAAGDRQDVRSEAVRSALELLARYIA